MLYFPEAGYFLWFIWALWWMFVIAPLFATKQKRLLLLGAALLLYCIPPFLPEVFCLPQIRNYAPNMIQKRKESASLVKRGHSASNVTIKTYKCPLPHHAT